MQASFPRHPFDAARAIVDRKMRSARVVGCALFALISVCLVVSLAIMIAATIAFDFPAGYIGPCVVVVVILSAIPWTVHMVRGARKIREILANVACPNCGAAMKTSIDGPTNVYVLICAHCRVAWMTQVGAPSSGTD